MKRFIAEWEQCEAILLAMPDKETDWNYCLREAEEQYVRLVKAFVENGEKVILLTRDKDRTSELLSSVDSPNLIILEAVYNDTWTRDYGPLSIEKHGEIQLLDFGFNGWGLKFASDKDNLVNLRLSERSVFNKDLYRNNRDFTLEGGSVESDGGGTILTTTRCLCSPNRNGGKSKQEINSILYERLGADHVLWLDYGALEGDDTDSHIDTLARLCPHDTILFTGCRDMDDPHFEELLHMHAQLMMFRTAEGDPYNLVELPLPDPVYDPEDGSRLPATYANYLVTEKNIFVPVYGQPQKDELACQTVRIVFPDKKVVPVRCNTLLRQHGSLHCATMQLPKGAVTPLNL